jgi:2',3'-cyclic-nucleotide 2'-phosphodiesterase (5'-nucleotidase family)
MDSNMTIKKVCLFLLLFFLLLSSCDVGTADLPDSSNLPTRQVVFENPTITPFLTPTFSASPTTTPVGVFPIVRTPTSREPLIQPEPVSFRILHWNDFHANIIENKQNDWDWAPGAGRFATVLAQERAKVHPNAVLLLDAGDWMEGTYPGFNVRPLQVLEIYKMMGVNAVTIGNHEFFPGMQVFYSVLEAASPIEMLSTNFRISSATSVCDLENRIVNAYKIYELGDKQEAIVRVAVVGMGMRNLQYEAYGRLDGICFPDPVMEFSNIYDELISLEKPDLIVLLTHMGFTNDKRMAKTLNGIGKPADIIIGGHSHTVIDEPAIVGNTLVLTAGDVGHYLGVLDLVFNRGDDTLSHQWQLIELNRCIPEDPEVMDYLYENFPDVMNRNFRYKNAELVSLVIGTSVTSNGLETREEDGDDGSTEIVEKGGLPAITNMPGSNYLYLDIDDSFYFGCLQDIEVIVEYFDEGYGVLNIEIDKADINPEHSCDLCYSAKRLATLNNTKTWKTAIIRLDDATFNGNQKWGTDFRLSAYETPIYIHSITIRKNFDSVPK